MIAKMTKTLVALTLALVVGFSGVAHASPADDPRQDPNVSLELKWQKQQWNFIGAMWWNDVVKYVEAIEHAKAQEAAEHAQQSVKVRPPSSGAGASSGNCANPVVPESIAKRESGCTYTAYNRTGCGGRGCIGYYQLDAGHWYAVSPWNHNAHGTCYGMGDPWNPSVQDQCAAAVKARNPGAWNL